MQRLNTANKMKKSNKELKGYKINPNCKPKTLIKPYSANIMGRSLKIGQNKMIRNKYSIDKAVRVIQKHFRTYLSKLKQSHNELKEMIKQKKLGIIQSYNIVLDTEPFQETAKFGVNVDNFQNTNNDSLKEEHSEDNNITNTIDNSNRNVLIETKHKEIAKEEESHHRNRQMLINNDLIGLKRRFYYNDEDSNEDNDNKYIIKNKTEETLNQQRDKCLNINQIKHNANTHITNKKESIYERLYKEMKNRQKNSATSKENNKTKKQNNQSQPEIDVQGITLFHNKKEKQKENNKTSSLNQQSNSVCIDSNKKLNIFNIQFEIKKEEEDNKSTENLMNIPCLVKFQKKAKVKKANNNAPSILEVSKISKGQTDLNSNINQFNENINNLLVQQRANDITIISAYSHYDLNAKFIKSKKVNELLNKTIKDLKNQLQIKEKRNNTNLIEQIKNQQELILNLTAENQEKENLIKVFKETISQLQTNCSGTINSNKENTD